MRSVRIAVVVWWLACSVHAQAGCQWLNVDGATTTAVGVLWSHGFDDDAAEQAGLARVLATCRLERARRAVPNLLATGMQIGGDYSLAFAVVPGGDAVRAKTFLAALLADGPSDVAARASAELSDDVLSDDVLALARARAALAADDATFVYPGDVLLRRARARLGQGTALSRPPAGIASAIQKLTAATIREALLRPVKVRIAALGVVDAQVIKAVGQLLPQSFETKVRGDLLCTERSVARDMTEDQNDRTDSPYVCAAFAVPAGIDRAALALGLQVATGRAFRRWQMRGREQQARAPFVDWSWLQAEPIVRFCRRGENPEQLLPGQRPDASVQDEVQATVRELKALLEDLRTVPPAEAELGGARAALRARLSLPGPGESPAWALEPATLPGRLQVLLLAAHHGLDVERIDTLPGSEVHAALKSALRSERASWHALLPLPTSRHGYRRR